MPKSKKRVKKERPPRRVQHATGDELQAGDSVGLISSLRGGFQDLAGTRPQKGADRRGLGVAGILVIALIALALIAFFARGAL